MKYGKYALHLSIGYSQAQRQCIIDLVDYIDENEWERMNELEQDSYLTELNDDINGQHIELNHQEVD